MTNKARFMKKKIGGSNLGPIGLNCFLMMNCFCGMVDRRKAFSLIFSRDHCQRSPPSRISDTPRAGLFKKWDDLFKSGITLYKAETATMRHRVIRKRSAKRLKRTGNLFGKNSERCLLILDLKPFRS